MSETRHLELDRLGQLGEFEHGSSTDLTQESNTDSHYSYLVCVAAVLHFVVASLNPPALCGSGAAHFLESRCEHSTEVRVS